MFGCKLFYMFGCKVNNCYMHTTFPYVFVTYDPISWIQFQTVATIHIVFFRSKFSPNSTKQDTVALSASRHLTASLSRIGALPALSRRSSGACATIAPSHYPGPSARGVALGIELRPRCRATVRCLGHRPLRHHRQRARRPWDLHPVVLEAHSPWAAGRKQERIKREEEQRGARLGRETEEGTREEGGAAKLLDCWFPIL